MNSKLNKAFKDYMRNGSLDAMKDPELVLLMQNNNIVFPAKDMSHDELISELQIEMAAARKKDIVESFIVGLENGETQKRAVLSAYAIMLNFPEHKFTSSEGIRCDICNALRQQKIDFTFCNIVRHMCGVTISGLPEQMYFFLRESNNERPFQVSSVSALASVLDTIRTSSTDDTPVILEKRIRKSLNIKISKEESRGLLDLLGHIGVLESPEHKGFIESFKNLGHVPRKSRSTDWSYPVDFWKGEYGVNEEAVIFWFGDYLKG
ncbi:hypothetical protein ALQ50_00255 [Pseudomonas coronafaciens pv. coronafaciens]|uniref:hypothetical protein n=1 Tax=Pseudomonas coronafaciens TaxID=53409 RepID=UPI0006D61D53|nr:hypothetical protein [Pseudomonas coronafaciens]KPW39980.1 Uncharacterized protein ALO66_00218 [Pseudomonas coronafaciens pv. atropurpurea]KPZ26032.1 hypothetical protein ALO38_200248 [Pseudomonas coronafaciens pv. zizaniae]RMN89332.1 hypothetical protein ALQ50_00255 [Pseudomonas coronafaciens pv. coronafaciens]RMT63071.1 hypothetical protein ALP45_200110 [Pseudomonas coronafaciens pv. atropurpurea]